MRNLLQKYTISLKLLYFLIKLQFFSFYHFRGPFSTERFGISKDSFGRCMGLFMSICFFSDMLIAAINDKMRKPKLIMCLMLIFSAASFELFFFWPAAYKHNSIYWLIMFTHLIFNTTIPPLLDHFVMEYLHSSPYLNPKSYGRQRVWGAFAFFFGNMISEQLCRKGHEFDFTPLKYYVPIATIPAIIITIFMMKSYDNENKKSNDNYSWFDLFKNKPYMFFIFIILLNGITRTAMSMYLQIYQIQVLKLKGYHISEKIPFFLRKIIELFNRNAISTTTTCSVIFEMLCLYYSQNIISACGLYWPLFIAQIAQFLRFFGYWNLKCSNKHVYGWSMLLETLKGVNFGLTHASGVQIAHQMCPPHAKASSQMIYAGVFSGISSLISGQIFGYIFSESLKKKQVSIKSKYQSFSRFFEVNMLIASICMILFLYKYGFVEKKLKIKQKLKKQIEIVTNNECK